jgi:nucleotide-binding universal stress UspA family protein
MQQETAKCKRVANEYLAGVEKQLKDKSISVRSEVLVGKTADELVDYANKNPFNLIVMATHGRAGLSRWVYGSVAEYVLLGVSGPVLLVRQY